ncbi:MAG: hypothetical protein RBS88_07545 [Spongiibacteraceae bacterium]|jgi:hypothetical protein|nr:hypothetical protein [Spongiibacteraceae bacterium]
MNRLLSISLLAAAITAAGNALAVGTGPVLDPPTPSIVTPENYEATVAEILAKTSALIANLDADLERQQAAARAQAEVDAANRLATYTSRKQGLAADVQTALTAEVKRIQQALAAADKQAVAARQANLAWYNDAKAEAAASFESQLSALETQLQSASSAIEAQTNAMLTALDMSYAAARKKVSNTKQLEKLDAQFSAARQTTLNAHESQLAPVVASYEAQKTDAAAQYDAEVFKVATMYSRKKAAVEEELTAEKRELQSALSNAKIEFGVDMGQQLAQLEADYAAAEQAAEQALQAQLAAAEAAHRDAVAAAEAQALAQVKELDDALASGKLAAHLNWTIPDARVDGAPLTVAELAGYELYYSSDDAAEAGVITISGGATTSHVVNDLPQGVYFFAISAIDSNGLKSDLSEMVEAQIGL